MDSSYGTWMNRYRLDHPDEITPGEADENLELLARKGIEHEAAYLVMLKSETDVSEPTNEAETIAAMHGGAPVIFQAHLSRDNFAGIADFLVRVDGASDGTCIWGDYHYEVWDTKLARRTKPYFLIQLCGYADMLEAIQGRRPDRVGVVLGDGERKTYRTEEFFYYYRALKRSFEEFLADFDAEYFRLRIADFQAIFQRFDDR